MTLPSIRYQGNCKKPKIYVLEVKSPSVPQSDAPIAWLLLEQSEQICYETDGQTITTASLTLSYCVIDSCGNNNIRGQGAFHGSYSHAGAMVSLTSDSLSTGGAVFLNLYGLQGHRIGTYLMNEIICWAKQWPDASIHPVQLLSMQATADNKVRRNRFYEQFGLTFNYTNSQQEEGTSTPAQVSDLHTVNTWQKNITVHLLMDYIKKINQENAHLHRELQSARRINDNCKDIILSSKKHPFRWLFKQLFPYF